jgi:hypothetical protein
MAVLDIQRRGQQIGRIRIGQQVSTGRQDKDGNDKTRPVRLDTFRFTTGSRMSAEAIAELYGGEIREWEGEWEVITRKSEIGVTVPPRDEVISQWYEMWNKGGCLRRCDSQREQISDGPCQCPHAEDPGNAAECEAAAKKRAALASLNPPQACKLVTRISVMIPDLPGLGVFRLDTGSYYAAVEIGDSAQLMQAARDRGVFLPAILRIEHRQRVAGGQTKKFPVPVLEVLTTFRDLATGAIERGGIAAQLPPAPGEARRAITAPVPPQAVPKQAGAHARPPGIRPGTPEWDALSPPERAQRIADQAAKVRTPADIDALLAQAGADGVADDMVCLDDVWEELRSHLQEMRAKLPGGAA